MRNRQIGSFPHKNRGENKKTFEVSPPKKSGFPDSHLDSAIVASSSPWAASRPPTQKRPGSAEVKNRRLLQINARQNLGPLVKG